MTDRSVRRRGVLSREDLKLWAHVTRGVDPMKGRPAVSYEAALAEVVAVPPSPPPETRAPTKAQATAGAKAEAKTKANTKQGQTAAARRGLAAPPAPPSPPLAPIERKLRQRLSRGQKPVDGVIDLHGMRQSEAHAALIGFIHRAQGQGRAVVLVITGKGGAAGKPEGAAAAEARGVLRRAVPQWLGDQALRQFVVGFEPAARGHGGEGALYVRIRKLKG